MMKIMISKRGKLALSATLLALFVFSVYVSYAFAFEEHVDETECPLVAYCHTGAFDYTFTLKDNVLFGKNDLEMGLPSFTKIVDMLHMHYQSSFVSNPNSDSCVDYSIYYIVSSENWERRYDVIGPTQSDGPIEEFFTVNFGEIAAYIEAVEKELAVVSREYAVDVHVFQAVRADCGEVDIEETYDDCYSFSFESNVIKPDKDAVCTTVGEITETVTTVSSTGPFTKAGAIMLNMLLVLGAVLTYRYIKPQEFPLDERVYRSARRHFKDYLMEAEGQPPKFEGTVIDVVSLQDLSRIAVGLNKPILHYRANGVHNYYVVSDEGIYHFVM